ncbi:MAG TPA: tyrosine--tRNA ligase [Candidatus Woesebacteria bacterium]|nr:tyrosine--tRNA ligase [Candidatus Woesebacteria bacterium]
MLSNEPNHLDQVLSRGVEQILPDKQSLQTLMSQKKIRLYLGIDPTGSLLTLGHAVVLRKLQQFVELGHEVILLVGNGTVRIGDPTGKDTTRPELSDEQIEANFQDWQNQASKLLDFAKITVRHNGEWLDQLKLPDFIKLMAKTTVQQLLERDMFQKRLDGNQPIYTHELMYPLLQGYDSVAMDVDLEIGGSDQLFNMLMGKTLLKIYRNKPKWVLTTPIINGLDGRKMSKSYGNYVALNENPQDMFGKLMSLADENIIPYMKVLTDISLEEIAQYQTAMESGANPMEFKKILARTITEFFHDNESALTAQSTFETVVQNKGLPDEIKQIHLPAVEPSVSILSLVQACLPQESAGNLKRLIAQGAVELVDAHQKPTDYQSPVELHDDMVVRVGKRQFFKVKLS